MERRQEILEGYVVPIEALPGAGEEECHGDLGSAFVAAARKEPEGTAARLAGRSCDFVDVDPWKEEADNLHGGAD